MKTKYSADQVRSSIFQYNLKYARENVLYTTKYLSGVLEVARISDEWIAILYLNLESGGYRVLDNLIGKYATKQIALARVYDLLDRVGAL